MLRAGGTGAEGGRNPGSVYWKHWESRASPSTAMSGHNQTKPSLEVCTKHFKGFKKGIQKGQSHISPPGEAGKALPPQHPPLFQLPEMLDTVEAQSSGIHTDTAQLCELEEPIQKENLPGGNSNTKWIRALALGCSQLVHGDSYSHEEQLPACPEPPGATLGKQGWGGTSRCQPGLGSAPMPGQQGYMG